MEKILKPFSGYLALVLSLACIAGGIAIAANVAETEPDPPVTYIIMVISLFLLSALLIRGIFIVNPNHSRVCILFGKYIGTVKANGLMWVNPFYQRVKVSLRAENLETAKLKVNDKMGNPIVIGAILVWKVEDTFKTAFQVDNYEEFVTVQSEAAIRKLAGTFPYDSLDDHEATISLPGPQRVS